MLVIVQAYQLVALVVDCFCRFFRAEQKGEHLRVLVGVVRHEVGAAYLPRAEQLLGIIVRAPEPVLRNGREPVSRVIPHLFKGLLPVGLRVVRGDKRHEFPVGLEQSREVGFLAVGGVEPLVVVARHHLPFIEPLVNDANVVLEALRPHPHARVVAEGGNVIGKPVGEKTGFGEVVGDKEIVVKVDEVFGKVRDLMQVNLDK